MGCNDADLVDVKRGAPVQQHGAGICCSSATCRTVEEGHPPRVPDALKVLLQAAGGVRSRAAGLAHRQPALGHPVFALTAVICRLQALL